MEKLLGCGKKYCVRGGQVATRHPAPDKFNSNFPSSHLQCSSDRSTRSEDTKYGVPWTDLEDNDVKRGMRVSVSFFSCCWWLLTDSELEKVVTSLVSKARCDRYKKVSPAPTVRVREHHRLHARPASKAARRL